MRQRLMPTLIGLMTVPLMLVLAAQTPAFGQANVIRDSFCLDYFAFLDADEEPCIEEDIIFFGQQCWRVQFVLDARGGIHIRQHVDVQAEGEGQLSGATYHFVARVNYSRNVKKGETFTIAGEGLILDDEGELVSETLVTFHSTVNANGELVVSFEKMEVVCGED